MVSWDQCEPENLNLSRTRGHPFVRVAILPGVRGSKRLAFDGSALLTGRADSLASLDTALRGVPGLWTLLQNESLTATLTERTAALQQQVAAIEQAFDQGKTNAGRNSPHPTLGRTGDCSFSVLAGPTPVRTSTPWAPRSLRC